MRFSLSEHHKDRVAIAMLFVSPACFSTNMIIARAMADSFPPVAMAVARWGIVALLLGVWLWPQIARHHAALRAEWKSLMLLGGLGMGLCGAPIYLAGAMTTATNIGLIYAVCPILVLLFGVYISSSNRLGVLQITGMLAGFIGVVAILTEGSLSRLFELAFNAGDLLVILGTVAFALYSLGLKHIPTALPALVRFGAMACAGALWHLPFLVHEIAGRGLVVTPSWTHAGIVVLLVFVSSIGAYLSYGLIVSRLGAERAALVLYISPLYNAAFAVLILSEQIQSYHIMGTFLILGGLYLSTGLTRATDNQS